MTTQRNILLALVLMIASSAVFAAGACTYREAVMALERGNTVRGMALMRMAHRDGDNRATTFLAARDYPIESSPAASNIAAKQQNKSLASLSQVNSE